MCTSTNEEIEMILQIELSERVDIELEVTHYEFEKTEDYRDSWEWEAEIIEITLHHSVLASEVIENPAEHQLQDIYEIADLNAEYVDSTINDAVIKYLEEM